LIIANNANKFKELVMNAIKQNPLVNFLKIVIDAIVVIVALNLINLLILIVLIIEHPTISRSVSLLIIFFVYLILIYLGYTVV